MALCKFYQQGYCKFGQNCRFVHADHQPTVDFNFRTSTSTYTPKTTNPAGNPYRWVSPGTAVSSTPSSPVLQRKPSVSSVTVGRSPVPDAHIEEERIIKAIESDITEWAASHQWPFSAYGFKNLGSILGFIDLSLEELRHRAYLAKKAGNFSGYENEEKQLVNAVRLKWDQLLSLSPKDKSRLAPTLKKYAESALRQQAEREAASASVAKPTYSFILKDSARSNNAQEEKPNFSFRVGVQPIKENNAAKGHPMHQKTRQMSGAPHSDQSQLSAEELKAFQDSDFAISGFVPINPPPKQFC